MRGLVLELVRLFCFKRISRFSRAITQDRILMLIGDSMITGCNLSQVQPESGPPNLTEGSA
ncbi:hypothetical protein ACLOJK_011510 [Asimina triloba]